MASGDAGTHPIALHLASLQGSLGASSDLVASTEAQS